MPLGEAARELRVSRAAIYRRVERGTLRSRPRGNRGLEVLLTERQDNVTPNVTGDHPLNGQSDRHPDEQGYIALDSLKIRDELAEARIAIARLEERLAAAGDVRAAIEAKAQGAVDAATLAAKAEVEAIRTQVATQITSRNAVIEELKAGLEHERAERAKLAAELAEARKGWLERLLEAMRRR